MRAEVRERKREKFDNVLMASKVKEEATSPRMRAASKARKGLETDCFVEALREDAALLFHF